MTKILIVEDTESTRDSLIRIITEAGYDVRGAENGRKALEMMAEQGPFDAVTTDIGMPIMDGHELLNYLKESESPPPVLVISAKFIPNWVEHPNKLIYLEKPVLPKEVIEGLERLLQR